MKSPDPGTWRSAQWRMLGNWEPKMFLYRRGDATFLDVEKLWADGHGERAIARMIELGINVAHIHFHKGYGLEFERESIEEATRWAQQLHQAGIRVGAYIGCTLFEETFDPALLERMAVKNRSVGWSGAQYFRRFWCWNNPEALRYFQEVVRVALQEVHADVLHFDSGFALPHDQLCHCEHCLAGFGAFVRDEISDIVRAAGYRDPERLQPPPSGNLEHLAGIRAMAEPGDIAWTLFHAQAGTRALRALAEHARSLAPNVDIFYNGANLCGITPYSRPNMEIQALEYADATAVEDDLENPVGVTAEGMAVSRFRAYKAGTRRRTRVYYYTCGGRSDARVLLAEAAAFNLGCLGMIELAMQTNRRLRSGADAAFLADLVAREDLFLDRTPWHNFAVVRHHESMLLNPFPSALAPYVVEQVLFDHHATFSIIGGDELATGARLADFEGLILPDSRCLSDGELRNLERFVRAGGWLLSIGNTAIATPLNQFRGRWGLADLFGTAPAGSEPRSTYEEVAGGAATDTAAETSSASALKARCGHGRVIHLDHLDFDLPDPKPLNRFAGFPWYYHPYWKPPRNASRLLELLDELQAGRDRVRTDLPRRVGLECYRVAGGLRLYAVNFDPANAVPPFRVSLFIDENEPPIRCVERNDRGGDVPLEFLHAGGRLEIQCPGFEVLDVLTVRFETGGG